MIGLPDMQGRFVPSLVIPMSPNNRSIFPVKLLNTRVRRVDNSTEKFSSVDICTATMI